MIIIIIIIIIIADKYHAPAFTCYINEFMIVLVDTSSHLIKQQKRDEMRGSVCLDIFMEFGTSFFLSLHEHIVETCFYLYFLGVSCQVSIKGSNSFCPKKDTK
jgi:hypothetical protein